MSVLHTNINEVVSLFVTEHGVTIITYVGDETESVSLNHDDMAAVMTRTVLITSTFERPQKQGPKH